MANHLSSIPEQFQGACAGFLVDSYQAAVKALAHGFGIQSSHQWASDEDFLEHLYSSPMAEELALVSSAAAQAIDRGDKELWGAVHDALNSLLASVSLPPGSEAIAYRVAEEYWKTAIGQMFALAKLWLDGDQLITISEAARLQGVPLTTMAGRVNRGNIRSYPDPRAKHPQKAARLVVRADL